MTYCLAIKIETGLVFCSDSRTNAGADQLGAYSKLHQFDGLVGRRIVLLSAGNLATTQAVVTAIERDLAQSADFNLNSAQYLSEIADYVGTLSLETQRKYAPGGPNAGFDASASFIVGGQIAGQEPNLYMIYPEGNHITPAEKHPFLQIGETKYGKPILERIITAETTPETAMRCALVSMDSTMHSNATVGPPIELLYFKTNDLNTAPKYLVFEENDPHFAKLSEAWASRISEAFNELPVLEELLTD